MEKCRNPHCNGTADKESPFCLAHIQLLSLHIEVKTPAPVQPPHEIHDRLMRELRMERYQADSQEAEGESAS